jgi:serine phosphatase RsbU (regulator of sigma subunit)
MPSDEDLQLAKKIQQSVLPKNAPYIEGYEISTYMIPAKDGISGDFYGYIPLLSGPKTIGLYVGDVVDKGLPAAMYMMLTNGILRAGLSLTKKMDPYSTLVWLNNQLVQLISDDENYLGMSLTMVYGILDASTHSFQYARGGHERIYSTDSQGKVMQYQDGDGQTLGLFHAPKIAKGNIYIPPGGILMLYTDGITDETDPKNQSFGYDRLEDLLSENIDKSADEITSIVSSELINWRGETTQFDDCTLMVIKRNY